MTDEVRNFDGLVKRDPAPDYGRTEVCPKCHGHGQWNLEPPTPKRPEPTRMFCSACWGYGYIPEGGCAHEWVGAGEKIGRCLYRWTCGKCGATQTVDSSD